MAVAIVLRSQRAALRFWLWRCVALKMLLLPFSIVLVVPVLAAQVEPPTATALPREVTLVAPLDGFGVLSNKPQNVELTPCSVLFATWTLIVAVQFTRCIRSKLRLNRVLAECTPAARELSQRLRVLSNELGIRTPTRLLVGRVEVPFVTGVLCPQVVIPFECAMEGKRFDQVVLHELSHIKRNDLAWVWIPELARMLFFFHPLMYWVRYQANLCREIACDESVLRTGVDRSDYANTLLAFAGADAATNKFQRSN
jgi:beta-lactamase regulating signal transducer with metallopeptidase domain